MNNDAVEVGDKNDSEKSSETLEKRAGSGWGWEWLAKVLTPLGVALLAFGGVFLAMGQAQVDTFTQMGVAVESQARSECIAIEDDDAQEDCLTEVSGLQSETREATQQVVQDYLGLSLGVAMLGIFLIAGGTGAAAWRESKHRELSLKHSRLVAQQR